jgi:hypothetical protein
MRRQVDYAQGVSAFHERAFKLHNTRAFDLPAEPYNG